MANPAACTPANGDRVVAHGHQGVFTVTSVYKNRRTADLQSIGETEHSLNGVPWRILSFFNAASTAAWQQAG
jgi:hypothetical protein